MLGICSLFLCLLIAVLLAVSSNALEVEVSDNPADDDYDLHRESFSEGMFVISAIAEFFAMRVSSRVNLCQW